MENNFELNDKQKLQERYDSLQMEILNEEDDIKRSELQEEANKIEEEIGHQEEIAA